MSGDPRLVVSTAAFHARVRGSFPVSAVCARPQTDRARISHDVPGGQCHLNHLTILRRLSWPSLAYMCTKVAQSPINFIFASDYIPPEWNCNQGFMFLIVSIFYGLHANYIHNRSTPQICVGREVALRFLSAA